MFRFLNWTKRHFSHVRASSWHYQVAKEIWGANRLQRSKACSYYWFKLPLAVLVFLVKVVFLVVVILAVSAFVLFWGYIPTIVQEHYAKRQGIDTQLVYPYKRLPNGKRIPVALWELTLLGVILYTLYYWVVIDPETGGLVLSALVYMVLTIAWWTGFVVLPLAAIGFVLVKGWKYPLIIKAREDVKAAWDKVCPPLTVETD